MSKTQKLYEALKTAVTVLRDLEALASEVKEDDKWDGVCDKPQHEEHECVPDDKEIIDEDEYSDLMCDVNRAAESCESAAESVKAFINANS